MTLAAVGDVVNEAAARRKSHLDEPEKRGGGMGDPTRRSTMFGDDILHQRFKKEATPRDTKIFRTFYYSHLIVPDGLDDEDGDESF